MNDADGRSTEPKRDVGELQRAHGVLDPRRLIHYMVCEPPVYELTRVSKKGIRPGAHREARKNHIASQIDRAPFYGRLELLEIGLAVMRFLRDNGGLTTRQSITNRLRYMIPGRRWKDDKTWRHKLRQGIYGAKRSGWLDTLYLPEGVPLGKIPGAPCPQCQAWMAPAMIEQVRALDYVPYGGAEIQVVDPDARVEVVDQEAD